jgi:hypothetical protein
MTIVESIRAEYMRYKALAESAIAQLDDDQLSVDGGGNSIAIICWHVSGNLKSRFTDFLTSDGEKPWRVRDEEFQPRRVTRAELLDKWEKGWTPLLETLATLTDGQLHGTVTIRGQALVVHEALLRSLAHTANHVGQIVFLAKSLRGDAWKTLSIPRGGSAAYNTNPTNEHAAGHTASLTKPR